jgi:hypothetical protein
VGTGSLWLKLCVEDMQGKGGELQAEPITAAAGWSLACLGHEGPPITRMLYLTQHPPALHHHSENRHPQLLELSSQGSTSVTCSVNPPISTSHCLPN